MTIPKTIERMNTPFEVKLAGTEGKFDGYGSIFGNVDSYNEIVAKGAFKRTLGALKQKGRMPAMLWMHDPSDPIGVWDSVEEDENGLKVAGQLAINTQKGADAYQLLKMGALTGLSIGYRVKTSRVDPALKARVLTDVDLFEISLVTFPANDATRVSGVKAAERIKTIREFEEFLRDEGGYSHIAARAIASGGFKARSESRDENGGLSDLAAMLKRNTAILQPQS